jgi:UDP-N-acetylmuramate dehydrogenase
LWEEIRAASSEGLGGWESLAGIPGTIGGAVRGNAGAFGSEMKDVVTAVTALHTETRERRTFTNIECEFDYRDSFFKQNPAWVVLTCDVELRELPAADSVAKADETVREREKRHLQNVACAGSFFMNPVAPQWVVDQFEEEKKAVSRGGRVPAGWLIEKVGMKGEKEGGAQASPMHPNYLMNTGTATARDVLTLAERIRTKIANDYMTHMFEEVTKVGL